MLIYDTIIDKLNGSNNIVEILSTINKDPLNLLEENEPELEDSLGSLISKLSCVTIQMWNNQDILYKIRFMTQEEFANNYNDDMSKLHNIIKRACDLNIQRTRLMDSIDQKILGMKKDGTL